MNQESQITNHPRRIARNIAWSFTEKATEFGISFLIGIAVARYLGPASYGGLSIALILAGFFQRLTVGGTILTTSRQIAQSQSQGERMEWEAAARKIVLGRSIGCTIAGFALAIFLPWEYGAPLAIALLAIPLNAGSCRFWALQTTLETKKTIVASRLSQIVGGATKLALLAFGAPGWLFAIASPVTEWTQTLWLTKGIKYPTPNPEKTKSLRGQAKTLRQSVLLKYMTAVLPNLGLGMVSATAAGIFAGATRLSSTAATGMGLYSQSVNPKVMNTGKWYDEWKMLTLAGAGLGILLWLTTPWLIPLLFGTAFNEAVAVGKILALGLIAEAGNSTLEAALVSKGETKGISRCWFIATGVAAVTSGIAWTCGMPPWEIAAIFAISMSIATGLSMLVLLKQKPQIAPTATGQAVEMP